MFIKVEDVILNTENIISVIVNKKIVKYGEEWYDRNEYDVDGVCVNMLGDCQYIFKTLSLGEFEKLLNIEDDE